MHPSFTVVVDASERRDLLDNCLEFDVIKMLVSVVTRLLLSVLSSLAFVANNMSDWIVRRSKTIS